MEVKSTINKMDYSRLSQFCEARTRVLLNRSIWAAPTCPGSARAASR